MTAIRMMSGLGLIGLLGLTSCGGNYDAAPTSSRGDYAKEEKATGGYYMDEAEEAMDDWDAEGFAEPAPAPAMDALSVMPGAPGKRSRPMGGKDKAKTDMEPGEPGKPGGDDGGAEVRQWFPESFLWSPLVETDESGTAQVDVRVPDQLTTWRVLALAHSRDGQQSGTVHTFDSRLPLYVDPVVPGWLYAGDQLQLPVQVVNTTEVRATARLEVSAAGALSGQGSTEVLLPALGSDVRWIPLDAVGAGASTVRATLGEADAAERRIPVTPEGRPVEKTRGGTLSSSRDFTLAGPKLADPKTQELAVLVFPGPLAVLQAEVERAGSGGARPWDAAYGFALSTHISTLSAKADTEVDEVSLRKLRLLAWQRVVKHSRSPDAGTAADLLAAMGGVEGHELAEELRDRMVRTVIDGQRSDGTWARQSSGSLQQVIVQTAFAGRTLPADQEGPRLRTSGALERYAREVKDPYTAAVVLASGLAPVSLQEHLLEQLDLGITERPDGTHTVSTPSGVVNVWGWTPSRAEVLAWTALALTEVDRIDLRGELVSELMAGYDATWGFGAGPADVAALEAVITALPGLDSPVDVVLLLDGKEVSRASLDPSQPKVPAALLGAPRASNPDIVLRVEPEVPGLAYVTTLRSWVPWDGSETMSGVEVEISTDAMVVGRDATLTLDISAPSGTRLSIEQGLPAGATVDETSLEALRGTLDEFSVFTDRIHLETRAFKAGEVMHLPITVRPAFAGRFSTLPLTLEATGRGGDKTVLPPLVWKVASEQSQVARAR